MKIFVTGATGVVGRRVVPMLIAAGHQVTAIGRTAEKRAALEKAGAKAVDVSLFDRDALQKTLAGHDLVINLATHIPESAMAMLRRSAWRENDRIRAEGSRNLVDAALAAGVKRFIQESFAPVYPDRGDQWIEESTPIRPVRYNVTVADAEASLERFTRAGGIGIVLRFAAFYGPDARHLDEVLPIIRKGWVPMPSKPSSFISSISHDDAATAVVAALDARAGVYNITDDEPVTRREYFDSLAAAVGARPPRIPPAWISSITGSLGRMLARSLRISNRKFRAETGWTPKYRSVREGWRTAV